MESRLAHRAYADTPGSPGRAVREAASAGWKAASRTARTPTLSGHRPSPGTHSAGVPGGQDLRLALGRQRGDLRVEAARRGLLDGPQPEPGRDGRSGVVGQHAVVLRARE